MSKPKQRTYSPGSVMSGLEAATRRTKLTIPELIEELQTALLEHDNLQKSHHIGRLLGTFCASLEPRLDVHPNRFSRVKTRHLSRILAMHPAMSYDLLEGGTFVDFGCGGLTPFAGMVVLLAAGASRCIGIDLDELNEPLALRALAKTAMELIAMPSLYLDALPVTGEQVRKRLDGLDIRALEQGRLDALKGFPLEFRNLSADATGIETGSVAGITSNSFLEHIPDPDAVIREMARISKPGAIGAHSIDGVDHRSYRFGTEVGVLDFLTLDSEDAIVFGCNRVRPLDFVERFERHGFAVLECETIRQEVVTERDRKRMVEPFRSMPLERLAAVGIRLAVQRR